MPKVIEAVKNFFEKTQTEVLILIAVALGAAVQGEFIWRC